MTIEISLQVSRTKVDSSWKKAKVKTSEGKSRDYFFKYSGGNDTDPNNLGGIVTTAAVDGTVTLSTANYSVDTMEFSNNKNKQQGDICEITSQTTMTISFSDNYSDNNKNINYSVIVNDTGDLSGGKIVKFECDPIIKNKPV